jgi:Membrane carboxypeptidase (penicillin-binding protein)
MALDRRDDRAPNYFLDYAFDEMKKLVSTFPKSMNERVFLVRTSVDSGLQRVADDAVENLLKQYGRDYHASQSAMVIADLEGGVRAMVGGRDYISSQFNRATDALRQPGSSFKPYVYATALEHGMKPTSIVVDGPVCIGNWCPHNYSGGYSGSMMLVDALKRSINTIAVKLSIAIGKGNAKVGRAAIVKNAKAMGLRTPLPDTPSLPIGADEVTVLDHTVAYATSQPRQGGDVARHPRGPDRGRRCGLAL